MVINFYCIYDINHTVAINPCLLQITAQANIDWSHPLLHIQFEQLNSNNPPSVNSVKAPVVWNGDVYALGRDHLNRGSLLKYSITHNKWSITLVPSEIYTPYSVLTTYLSELILISAQNRTIWEFDCNNDVFKESCIDPVPGPKDSFVATSQDNYLIIAPEMYGMFLFDDDDDHVVSVYIFDGTSWSAQQYDLTSLSSGSNVKWTTIIGNRTIFVVESDDDGRVTLLYKAPLLLGECKDSMKILMCNRMDEIDCLWRYPGQRSLLLLNNQLFLADSQGVICTTYIQPPIEVVWIFVDSGISFRQAPHIVRLPNGEWLMVGIIIHCDHEDLDDQSVINSQLDVISVHHKGIL